MTTPQISFEFFPPKTKEGEIKLNSVCTELAALHPAFFSVTYGAGGVTQEGTLQTVRNIQDIGQAVAPHLSCVGASTAQLHSLLTTYRQQGIRQLVALRGDLPSGMGQYGALQHADQLVSFIREQTGDWFHIHVAAYPEFHPQARSSHEDIQRFANKMKAGANSAITQYFFNKEAYFRFIDEAHKLGVESPIIPGIMPIINSHHLLRFSAVCGADIPRWIRLRLLDYADDTRSIRAFGLDVVNRLCEDLLTGGAPGLHFYTLNQAEIILKINHTLSSLL